MTKTKMLQRIERLTCIALVVLSLTSTGCSLCCSPYIDDYVTFGSRTPRTDMKHGRVGSVFSDPQVAGSSYVVEPSEEVIMDEGVIEGVVEGEASGLELGSVE